MRPDHWVMPLLLSLPPSHSLPPLSLSVSFLDGQFDSEEDTKYQSSPSSCQGVIASCWEGWERWDNCWSCSSDVWHRHIKIRLHSAGLKLFRWSYWENASTECRRGFWCTCKLLPLSLTSPSHYRRLRRCSFRKAMKRRRKKRWNQRLRRPHLLLNQSSQTLRWVLSCRTKVIVSLWMIAALFQARLWLN